MKSTPRTAAQSQKGLVKAYKWMLIRRASQIGFLLFFGLYAWFGIGLVKGSITSSTWLGFIPATEPLTFLQSLLLWRDPAINLIIGGILLTLLGIIFGARLFCGWICPVNIVSECTSWIKQKFGLKGSVRLEGYSRYGVLIMVLVASILGQFIAWESINPISNSFRAFLFQDFAAKSFTILLLAIVSGLWLLLTVVILDLFVLSNNFCKSLCPQGALYALLGSFRIFGITAANKDACTNCGDCYKVCPEEKILHEPLRGTKTAHVQSGLCTGCAQCVDVCCENVLKYDFFIKIPKMKKEHKE